MRWLANSGSVTADEDLKVAIPKITMFLPSLDGGGAERVFVELANEFVARGLRVTFALASSHGPYLDELAAGVRVLDFKARGVLQSLPKLVRHLRMERPDVLLSGLDHANVVAVLARFIAGGATRCVISMRSVPTVVYRNNRSTRKWLLLNLMKIAYPFADTIIANSVAVVSDVIESMDIPEGRIRLIYNPLNVAKVVKASREQVAHDWCAVRAPPIILGVGSLTVLKDFPTLIRAFSIVRATRDCRLVILGEGPERPRLIQLVLDLQLERDVYLAGFTSNPFPWMRHAAVLVSSSLTEGCPNALMQGLACGTAVIGTDCPGGSAEILQQGKWGHLTPVGDSRAMADAIAEVLQATVRPDVRRRANDFDHQQIARQYLETLLPSHAQYYREQPR